MAWKRLLVRFWQAAPFIEAWDISRPLALGARAGLGSTGRLDHLWGCSSIGRALVWQTRGCEFDSRRFHHISGIRTVWLLRVIWDHEIAGSNPAFRTILEPVLISFALGAAVCWFESSLPEHYREVGKLVKPAIISQVIMLH